ncbi:uncharacterized protein LOC8071394 [Sorghum bicolor]|uniref:uncharacterized protein LOC8071394 n=1 Tax=Sorghum bicolor TaxID=4558 RepID=UPI000B425510|nr:uncharacterized protein LOC8071394 [Sorghum bicolor]|eukprot:XP_021306706.1 uncharacterized protein LOC8071394 [Sorghum bicolor]
MQNDGGVHNNCFNLDCGGFHVQPSPYALGGAWNGVSQLGGDRFTIPDPTEEKWWVSVKGHDIGYYPESVFDTRFPEAFYVEMGGRVLNTRPGGKHTTTPMGSGMPPCAGWRFAAEAGSYYAVNYNGVISNDWADRTVVTTPGCYDAKPRGFDKNKGGYFVLFGGPGGIYCDK